MTEKYTESIYPRVLPSAPTYEQEHEQANDYRLKHIKDVKQELEKNSNIRKSLRKRYSNLNSSLDYSNYALNTNICVSGVTSISLLSTVALVPVSIVLGGLSAGCGVGSVIVTKLNTKFKHKQDKHRDIYNLCENKLNTINSILSKALNDRFISNEEFDLILKEEKHYREMKESIQSKRMIVKDNEEMKESVINFVKKLDNKIS